MTPARADRTVTEAIYQAARAGAVLGADPSGHRSGVGGKRALLAREAR